MRARLGAHDRLFAVVLATVLALVSGCSHHNDFYNSVPSHDPPTGGLLFRVLLIGDAGETDDEAPVLVALEMRASKFPDRTIIVFLGDNVYPEGVREDKDKSEDLKHLYAQIDAAVNSGCVEAVFVAGNHDWDFLSRDFEEGYSRVRRQARAISERSARARLLPRYDALHGGSPPVPLPFTYDVTGPVPMRIIFLDTQWWLFDCDVDSDDAAAVERELTMLVEEAKDRVTLVVGHHPVASHGPHGGHYDWQAHFFVLTELHDAIWIPLPGLGTIYASFRWAFTEQDLRNGTNRAMRDRLEHALGGHPRLIYAAGHEHSLQILESDVAPKHQLISGAGSKLSPVWHGDDTIFAWERRGFMQLDLFEEGVHVTVIADEAGTMKNVFGVRYFWNEP